MHVSVLSPSPYPYTEPGELRFSQFTMAVKSAEKFSMDPRVRDIINISRSGFSPSNWSSG